MNLASVKFSVIVTRRNIMALFMTFVHLVHKVKNLCNQNIWMLDYISRQKQTLSSASFRLSLWPTDENCHQHKRDWDVRLMVRCFRMTEMNREVRNGR